jgi:hypothetical protein
MGVLTIVLMFGQLCGCMDKCMGVFAIVWMFGQFFVVWKNVWVF